MTGEEIEAIEARAEAATDGPWASVDEWVSGIGADRTFTMIEAPKAYVSRDVGSGWDADFIAHAREDVPRLCAALREALARAEDALARCDAALAEADLSAKMQEAEKARADRAEADRADLLLAADMGTETLAKATAEMDRALTIAAAERALRVAERELRADDGAFGPARTILRQRLVESRAALRALGVEP